MRKLLASILFLTSYAFAGVQVQQGDIIVSSGVYLTTDGIHFPNSTVQNSAAVSGASALGVNYYGVSITSPTAQVNFVGAGVSVTNNGSTATVVIPGVSGPSSIVAGAGLSGGGSGGAVTINLSTPVSVANGGTGVVSPGLIAGTNITSITGTWPNQVINATTQSGSGSGVTLSSFTATQPILYNNATGSFSSTLISATTGIVGILPVLNGGTGNSTINTCNSASNALTWSGSAFGCNTIIGGSGGASTLAVQQNGVNITSPTVAVNFLSPPFSITLVNGSTSQVGISPSSVTLQGNSFNGISQLVQVNSSAQLPIISGVNLTNLTGANVVGNISGNAANITGNLPTTQLSGALQASQEPAHTGDVTNSAGSLAMTAAAVQANIKTFISSITVNNAAGILTTGPVSASSIAITGSGPFSISATEGADSSAQESATGQDNLWASSNSHALMTNYNGSTSTGTIVVSTTVPTNGHAAIWSSQGALIDGGVLGSAGVVSISTTSSGGTPITGAVQLLPGSNITLTQSGQGITVASSGGGGGSGIVSPGTFTWQNTHGISISTLTVTANPVSITGVPYTFPSTVGFAGGTFNVSASSVVTIVPSILYSSGTSYPINTPPNSGGANTNTTILDSGPLPALGVNACFNFMGIFLSSAPAGGDNYDIWYGAGANTGLDITFYASTEPLIELHGTICNNPGSQTTQTYFISGNGSAAHSVPIIFSSGSGSQTTTGNNLHISVSNATNNGSGVTTTTTLIYFKVWI